MALSGPPASAEPLTRGVVFHSLHEALRNLWGEEQLAAVVAALPAEIAYATFGAAYRPLTWYPVAYLEAWHEAVHAGPAGRDDGIYVEYMDRALDVSLGRLRRAFMRFMNPVKLAERSSELWRSFHTHGDMTVEWSSDASGRVTLVGHPFTANRLGRLTYASMVRYTLALSRAKHVRQEHAVDAEGKLTVSVTWDP